MNLNYEDYISRVRNVTESENKHAYVITFGCQQNEADSEKIRGMARSMGYTVTDRPDNASLIIVNTCAIREHAEMKALSLLGNFKALKKKNPELVIGVVGCMAAEPHRADTLKNDFHYISFTLEPSMLHKLPEVIWENITEKKRRFIFGSENVDIVEGVQPERASRHRAWVSIMYGCNNFCSYCIVPYVRGRERSRNSCDVIKECEALIKDGYKEITLLGQNVNSYNSDKTFPELIEAIAQISGDFIIRFMTSHPKDVSDKLIEIMGKYKEKIAPYFHLPLQSGSDKILKAMNRTYDRCKFADIVRKLRAAVPGIALSTDVIVGFPGESEDDFQDTLDVLCELRFDSVYAFMYSKREGTRAALMENQISDDIKSKRLAALFKIQDEISLEKNRSYLNRVVRVLVDSVEIRDGKNVYTARTFTNKLVHFEAKENCVGCFKNVKITQTGAFDLFGEEIERI